MGERNVSIDVPKDEISMSYTILVVEDDKFVCRLIKKELQRLGFHVEGVFTGTEAISWAVSNPDALLLLDYRLPDMTGKQVIEALAQRRCRVPFIVITGGGDEKLAVEMMKLGAHDYVVKDEDFLDLLPSIVDRVIEQLQIEKRLAKAEEALRESEENFRALAENANDGIVIFADKEAIVYANKRCAEMVDTSVGDLLSISIGDLVDLDMLGKWMERWQRVPGNINAQEQYETALTRKDGKSVPIEITVARTSWHKHNAHIVIIRDITERKQAEAALKRERASLARRVEERTAELRAANAELIKANRLKDEFLASMSHELRTPLNAILGMAEALLEEVYGALNIRQTESLRSIDESGRHLLDLINDILDISKIEAGKLELDIDIVSVESICQASLRLIRQDAQKKQLRVSSSIDSDVAVIHADGRRLKQILVNLLSNAVKFTPECQAIGLEVVGDPERQTAHFTVWDNGPGIPEDKLSLLFKPFFQLDSSLSRRHSGAGLGLALAHRLVELHNGNFSVESEVDKGSRFTISLPWQIT